LREALPPPAFRFFASLVRRAVERERGVLRRTRPDDDCDDHWLSRDEWTHRADGEELHTGIYFAAPFQTRYEQQMRHEAAARVHEVSRRSPEPNLVVPPPDGAAVSAGDCEADEPTVHVASVSHRPDGVPEGYVLVHLPTGPKWFSPAGAASCLDTLSERARQEAERERREDERREYYAKIGKPYPD
jgi:hypothetical protein